MTTPTFEVVKVTHQLAAQWMRNNGDNRPLRKSYITDLANRMRRGEWKLSPQPIVIGKSGRLLDGQHRLSAIIETGLTVLMTVAKDVEDSTFDVLDIGRNRSTSDVLGLDMRIVSVVRFLAIITENSRSITPQQYLKYHAVFGKKTETLQDFCASRQKLLGSAGVRAAAVLRMAMAEDEEWILLNFKALNDRDYNSLDMVMQSFLKQVDAGHLSKKSSQLFARALQVFNPRANRRDKKLQIKRIDIHMAAARKMIKQCMGEEPETESKQKEASTSKRTRSTNHSTGATAQP